MEVRVLKDVSMRQLHAAFSTAFSDYTEPWNKTLEELQQIIERRGYRADLSFAAFNNEAIASFTLNGLGMYNGQLTAYDTGTGTLPAYRKQGLASRIFNESVPVLKANGVSQYLLEVIKANTKAYELYLKQGFEVVREFDYYVGTKQKLILRVKKYDNMAFRRLEQPDWPAFRKCWEFEPSWQNSIDSINRKLHSFVMLGAFHNEILAGYGTIETGTGDIPQLAVKKEYRRHGLATMLVDKLVSYSESDVVKFINADTVYSPFREFMTSINLKPGHGQYEMIRKL